MNKAAQLIKERLPQLQIKEDLSLATCTSFRTGGPADVAAYPETAQELAALLKVCKGEGIPFYILGNGTNVLAPDEGFRGVIVLTAGMREVSVDAESATAVAGHSPESALRRALRGLSLRRVSPEAWAVRS